MSTAPATQPSLETLNGIPAVDVPANIQAALSKGRRAPGIAAEALAPRFGPGRLSPQEYLYYKLWDDRLPLANKKNFVGKMAKNPMHVAAGSREWFATSADKILFHSIMAATQLPTPETLAITQAGRHLAGVPVISEAGSLATFLRNGPLYPVFAKQVTGKYSLSVVSAESYDASLDEIVLLGGERRSVSDLAGSLVGGTGYLIQRRVPVNTVVPALLRLVPDLTVFDDLLRAPGHMCSAIAGVPGALADVQTATVDAAARAGADTVVTIFHSCHREFVALERGRAFRVVNWVHLLAEACGWAAEDEYKHWRNAADPREAIGRERIEAAGEVAFARLTEPELRRPPVI